ncbi:MAG TPA: sensor histidine kinase [Candidatus Acidoferrales bacterium]|nr:sensor histidine kinase [Candidatus Acidoferrales bacterium]
MRTQDDERRHIARELHETAGQSLAAMKMTLGRLRDTMKDVDDLAHALLKSATELAETAAREVRTVSYLMHPPMLDEAGLGPALRWYARGFSERSGISVRTEIPEALPRQPQEVETTIFRIVQEALTNVHRYSGSATAQIRVWCRNGDIHAEVRDNGRGFVEKHRTWREAEALGVGIAGMRERVAQLRGQFELHSTLGEGTMVHVALPSDGERADASTSSVTRMTARGAAARKAT